MLGGVALPRLLAALSVVFVLAAVPDGAASQTPTRYSLAGGCYELRSPAGQTVAGAERVRVQATSLGSYLLYRPDRTFLADQGDGSVAPAAEPSPAADWRVDEAGDGTFTLTPASAPDRPLGGTGARFTFAPADGCAAYPEADVSATGTPARGKTSYAAVTGLLEGHMHWMQFDFLGGEFRCGRPWHPYGIPYALPDCGEIEGPQGSAAPVQNVLNFGLPVAPHDTTGWPKLTETRSDNLTYEGMYWRWVQRAWLSGLRLMVMSVNENRVLCETLVVRKHNSCDEMDTVRRAFASIRELQRYVDAQAGGPGKGFFQIVTTPYEARRVINEGKMAVVLEIEISEPFGCRGWENPTCDVAQVDRQLDELHRLGMRSALLLNKFDNPLTGVRFDSGPIGVLINAGNKNSAGTFFSAETCRGKLTDNEIETFAPEGSAFLDTTLGALGVASGTLPSYPPAPHCNTRGLTALGRHLERRMIEKRMIINPDHMSQAAVEDTLTLAEAHHYAGVISPHGWMDPGNWPRIWKLGGLAFPSAYGSAENYAKAYETFRPQRTPYLLGWGYGADLGGLAAQPVAPQAPRVKYPFKSFDGKVTFERQRTGERTFDYLTEGVAHYGLYADWFEDLRQLGGQRLVSDMENAAEAYLQMWERADGIRAPGCRPARLRVGARGLGRLRLRASWETLLRRAGQPQQRTRAWSWCVRGKRNRRAADVAELNAAGRVELVGSTARGRVAGPLRVGAPAARVRRLARVLGGGAARSARPRAARSAGPRAARPSGRGLFVRRAGRRAAFVYFVRGGRVRATAVATRALARRPARLRAAMRRVLRARASQAPRTFVPNASPGASRFRGKALTGPTNPRLNRAFEYLCAIMA